MVRVHALARAWDACCLGHASLLLHDRVPSILRVDGPLAIVGALGGLLAGGEEGYKRTKDATGHETTNRPSGDGAGVDRGRS